ncbi:MAG: hypothetical protein HYT75_00980 [Deltaproteobacteria bacterium]|nr:hypothetical protein [Deltaproteobacteria bacterium]
MNEYEIGIKKLLHDINSSLTPLIGFLREVEAKISNNPDLSKYHALAKKSAEKIKKAISEEGKMKR